MPKQIKSMLELLGTQTNKPKDSDKDGVPDRIDCQPKNPNKQGLIHDISSRIKARRKLKREVRSKIETGEIKTESDIQGKFTPGGSGGRIARQELRKKEVREAYESERHKQRIKSAVAKAKRTKGQSGFSQFVGGFSQPSGTRGIGISGRKKQKSKSSPFRRGENIHDFIGKRFGGGL